MFHVASKCILNIFGESIGIPQTPVSQKLFVLITNQDSPFFLFFELLLAIHVALFYFVHDAFFSKVAMPDSREAQKRQLDLTVAQGTLPTRIQLRSMVVICQVTQVVTNPNSPMGFLRIQRWMKTLTI